MGYFNGKVGNAYARCHVTGDRGHPKSHILESATTICVFIT